MTSTGSSNRLSPANYVLDKTDLEILTFPLSSLLRHVNINATLDNSHDLLLCNELVEKVSFHLCSKLAAPTPSGIQIVQLDVPMFKVGTLDSLLGDGGIEQLERCLGSCCKLLNTLIESYEELIQKSKSETKMFNLVPTLTLLQNTMDTLTAPVRKKNSVTGQPSKCNSWNYAKYPSEGTLPEIIAQFDKEMIEIEQLVHSKKDQYLEIQKEVSKQLQIQTIIERLSREDCIEITKNLKECQIENLLESKMFVPAVLIGQPAQIMRLCNQTECMINGLSLLDNPQLQFVTILQKKEDEFRELMQREKIPFQLINQQWLEKVNLRTKSLSSLDLKGDSLTSMKALYIQSLVVGIMALLECKFHLTLLKSYYESVLEFGLPPVFVTILVSISHKKHKTEVEKFYRRFSDILNNEFMIQNSTTRSSFSRISFSIAK